MKRLLLFVASALWLFPCSVGAKEYPRYCCTDRGILGPYPNDSVEEGGACYGTDSSGKQHQGRACYGRQGATKNASGKDAPAGEYPQYCCTNAGVLGPYRNDTVKEGGACFGTDAKGKKHEGKACFGEKDANDGDSPEEDSDKDASEYPRYCCTDVGPLGPYENHTVREGQSCYGTDKQGRRHEGSACSGSPGAE